MTINAEETAKGEKKMSICGIDLGTTYSAISWFDPANNRVEKIDLESSDGDRVLPSVVYYPEGDNPTVVGKTALNAAKQDPDRVITAIKRSMGTDYQTRPIDGVRYTPQQVSAEILKTLARDAEIILGDEVKDVVITVPAYFGDNERAATEEAGQMAGLNVLGIFSEPHAAALAYSIEQILNIWDRYLLVYDLGGGTFDVVLIHATKSGEIGETIKFDIKTLCKHGNASLGGLDWDRALAELVGEKMMQEHSVDVWEDPRNEAYLMENCEEGKRTLSRLPSVQIIGDLKGNHVEVTLSEFEDRTADLLLQTSALLVLVLEDAEEKHGKTKEDIDILLAGGATRMPMVRQMIEEVMGKPPIQFGNPELLVTIGAAYKAHLLTGGNIPVTSINEDGIIEKTDVVLEGGDISRYAVGVKVLAKDSEGEQVGRHSVILPSGIPFGEEKKKLFETSEDGMTDIDIEIFKNESTEPEDLANLDLCDHLLTVSISGLPPGRPKGQGVMVKLYYDESGILRGEAKDVTTDRTTDFEFDRSKQQVAHTA